MLKTLHNSTFKSFSIISGYTHRDILCIKKFQLILNLIKKKFDFFMKLNFLFYFFADTAADAASAERKKIKVLTNLNIMDIENGSCHSIRTIKKI